MKFNAIYLAITTLFLILGVIQLLITNVSIIRFSKLGDKTFYTLIKVYRTRPLVWAFLIWAGVFYKVWQLNNFTLETLGGIAAVCFFGAIAVLLSNGFVENYSTSLRTPRQCMEKGSTLFFMIVAFVFAILYATK